MAILKFRAWHIKAKKYFECTGVNHDTCFIKVKSKRIDILGDAIEDYIIEQSTGLFDSFDTEIYEGDLMMTYSDSEEPYLVIWYQKTACWALTKNHQEYLYPIGQRFKVIGSIHENPDLMP